MRDWSDSFILAPGIFGYGGERRGAVQEAAKHIFDGGFAGDILLRRLGQLGSQRIIAQEKQQFLLERRDIVFRYDEAVSAWGEVVDFRRLQAVFRHDR